MFTYKRVYLDDVVCKVLRPMCGGQNVCHTFSQQLRRICTETLRRTHGVTKMWQMCLRGVTTTLAVAMYLRSKLTQKYQ
jgi:hypothetical protein